MFRWFVVTIFSLFMLASCVAACSSPAAEFEFPDLRVSPMAVEVYEEATISVDVANIGDMEGTCTVNVSVGSDGGYFSQDVTLLPGETRTIDFVYVLEEEGEHEISVGGLSRTLAVTRPMEGMWSIPYRVAGGEITMMFSLMGGTPVVRTVDFPTATFDMYVSKNVINGSREVIIDDASFRADPVVIPDIFAEIDMELLFMLDGDAVGQLYVEDGIADVDVISEDVSGAATVYSLGDGVPDTAGAMLMDSPSLGESYMSIGLDIMVPMDVLSTTGYCCNHVSRPGAAMDGSVLDGSGVHFARDGGPAPYVGTSATIVATGASLNQRFVGYEVDFQFRTVMQIEPID
ncbi:MAG: CARDB domain-containing protein [Chloroflexota bacterium]|nr:CARDB domain-containing protein [Chloroflexota bacterium]